MMHDSGQDEPRDDRAEGGRGQAVLRAAHRELDRLLAEPLASGLYLVATPIGNLADLTLRALAVLTRAEAVYCEDTRHSLRLMQRYGLERPLRPYHEHNARRERPLILARLAAGEALALISDAGTPLVSDPGFKLVREALAAGRTVTSIPGPSAVLAGLTSSGLPTDAFHFAGFPPAKAGQRQAFVARLARVPGTLVLFEAPSRLADTLEALAATLGPRPAAVARELTKLHEEVRRGTLAELAGWATALPPKGEMVILVGPGEEAEVGDAVILAALAAAGGGSRRDAVDLVSADLGVARRRVYELANGRSRTQVGPGPRPGEEEE